VTRAPTPLTTAPAVVVDPVFTAVTCPFGT